MRDTHRIRYEQGLCIRCGQERDDERQKCARCRDKGNYYAKTVSGSLRPGYVAPAPPPVNPHADRDVSTALDLVPKIARLMWRRYGAGRPLSDLESDGYLGLVLASRTYAASDARGASFRTYAWAKIQGRIQDGWRRWTRTHKSGWAPIFVELPEWVTGLDAEEA